MSESMLVALGAVAVFIAVWVFIVWREVRSEPPPGPRYPTPTPPRTRAVVAARTATRAPPRSATPAAAVPAPAPVDPLHVAMLAAIDSATPEPSHAHHVETPATSYDSACDTSGSYDSGSSFDGGCSSGGFDGGSSGGDW